MMWHSRSDVGVRMVYSESDRSWIGVGSECEVCKMRKYECFIGQRLYQPIDELDEYLTLPIERVRDPLTWWWDHRHAYPQLSVMAFDFLSAPGMRHHLLLPIYADLWCI